MVAGVKILSEEHQNVLDNYLGAEPDCKGSGRRSWQSVYPRAGDVSAANSFYKLTKRPEAAEYLAKRQQELSQKRLDKILYSEEQADADLAAVQADAQQLVPMELPRGTEKMLEAMGDRQVRMQMRDGRLAAICIEKRAANSRGNLGGEAGDSARPQLSFNMNFGSSKARPPIEINALDEEAPPQLDKNLLEKGRVVTIGKKRQKKD